MKKYRHRASIATLTLVVCLAVAPLASAAPFGDRDYDLSDRIARIVSAIQKLVSRFGDVTANTDYPTPPKP
jgi:hypothetical protein